MIIPVFENILTATLSELSAAKKSIKIVMAWFTDPDLFEKLIEMSNKAVDIDLVLLDHASNKNNIMVPTSHKPYGLFKLELDRLRETGANIVLIDAHLEFYLHSKFCIIDSQTVITGSYNWTYSARTHIENIVIIRDGKIAKAYDNEFQRISTRKLQILKPKALPRCKTCDGFAVTVRIYDYFDSNQSYDEVKDILFCLNEPLEHLEEIDDLQDWSFTLGEVQEQVNYAIELEQGMTPGLEISPKQRMRRFGDALSEFLGSRNDLNFDNAQNAVLILAKRTADEEKDCEFPKIEIIWHNDLVGDFAEVFEYCSEDLMEQLYG
ncbi:phospholipase D-like domain-containing protein [Pedobacter sp. Leaf250]|uniref:phospholipase D-like domain-containing protein n=1 Tax=Pedobacter sp. Leaf250 TaxID=2876559 RepID=UPI001E3E765B|nr:phospholipase D-like domain-containing protein [Pedobacter sp. Leaf250]